MSQQPAPSSPSTPKLVPLPTPDRPPRHSALLYRVSFFVVAALIVSIVIAMPFAVHSLTDDLFNSVESPVYTFTGLDATHGNGQIHVSVVDVDEARLRATLRVSGHRHCPAVCPPGHRIALFSLWTSDGDSAGTPPSANVDLTAAQAVVTQNIELPIHGHPTLYPFDTYDLWLGIGLAAILPDGAIRPITREESAGLVRATIQEQLTRETMVAPTSLALTDVEDPTSPYQLLGAEAIQLRRPLHERVLAVLLVLLVAAAAAYAVFMRPLHDLVINAGGLVLGVWGIRALLSPGTATKTVVDLALSVVILFLLSAITFRALQFLYERGQFRKPKLAEAETDVSAA